MNKAMASIFMSIKNMSEDLTEDSFKNKFSAYLKDEHQSLVTDVKLKRKGLAIIFCQSWDLIATNYKNKFLNHDVTFTLFSAKKPAATQA